MPQAVTDLIAGRVSILVVDRGPILPHLEYGAARALMVTTSERSRLQPEVPSSREAGSDIDIYSGSRCISLTNGISSRVSAELRKVVRIRRCDRLSLMGFETRSSSPAQVAGLSS